MIIVSLSRGLAQVWANKRMLLLFYFVNLLFGLVLLLPLRAALTDFVSQRLMGTILAGRFDMNLIFEFIKNYPGVISTYKMLFLFVPIVFWLVILFLSAGAFAIFAGQQAFSSQAFWRNAGAYFGRFVRLALLSLPLLGLFLCLHFVETGVQRLLFGGDPYEYISYWGAWVQFGLRAIGILLFGLVLDYARIHVVITDETRMRRALWQALRFVFAHFGRTFGLALSLYVIGAALLAAYYPLANALYAPNGFVVLALFLLQQLFMVLRAMLRLTLYSSQTFLFRQISTAYAPEEPSLGDLGLQSATR